MELFKYSMAVMDWNGMCEHYNCNIKIAGYEFCDGQYYFDFGF